MELMDSVKLRAMETWPYQRMKLDFKIIKIMTEISRPKKQNGLITAGYILACMPILILPIVFTLAGVGVGIVNISRDENGHGIAQIAIAVLAGLIGTMIGGAGFNL